MNFKTKLYLQITGLITAILFLYLPAGSQTVQNSSGKYTYETVQGDPLNARIYKLENGLTVYMTVYKDEPRIQTYIVVKAGSKFDPSDATGMAHYLEHMLFKGTDKYGTKNYAKEKPLLDEITNLFEKYRSTTDSVKRLHIYHIIDSVSGVASTYAIANEYDKMMSSIGAKGTNAWTSNEQTVYTEDIPSNELNKWVEIEAERFRNPVLRLFHTELEAVYEEKNMGMDNDGTKMWESLYAGLFQKHQYGTQTTIGTIHDLKNPSLKKVIEYEHTYYVPDNMAICMSGDFDMDEAIKIIDEKFGSLQPKPVPGYTPPVESSITSPIVKDVYGPEAEELFIGFRIDGGANTKDAALLSLTSNILYNGSVGLIDDNLNQHQKVLETSAFSDILKDYSALILDGKPRKGQTLEEVKDLLLEQIKKLKNGDFPDWMIPAIINNMKLSKVKSLESNRSRAYAFVRAFTNGTPWDKSVAALDDLSKLTKEEVVEFAKANFNDNYVVVYKHVGEDKNVKKIPKPVITPVQVNRNVESDFLKNIEEESAPDIKPVFIDYNTDILKGMMNKDIPLYYKSNTENNLFNLYYVVDFGTKSDKLLGLATEYLQYLGTSKYSPAELKQEFFKLGCSFGVSSSSDRIFVSLNGINDNFESALKLFEEFLAYPKPDKDALDNLVIDILKQRKDDKLDKDKIFWDGLLNYGKYGKVSEFTDIMSEDRLKSITPDELVNKIKQITTYPHLVLYYGPSGIEAVTGTLNNLHKIPEQFARIPAETPYPELSTDENKVYFVNYPGMVQTEIIFLSKDGLYDKTLIPGISMYNEYFGSGMSGIVFQELRESKALAYSVFSAYRTPMRLDESFTDIAYIGTQADKLSDAMKGIIDLLNDMPLSENTFNAAKNQLLQQLASSRVTKTAVLFNYLNAKRLNLDYDIRKDIYENIPSMTLQDVHNFSEKYVKGKNHTILVMGDKDKLDMKALEGYGNITTLTLEDLFGY
ncbi:MAG: M16 family metallopeptidase [Ignavibacteria bacterium]